MGRTNIVLDEELVAEGLKLSRAKTIRELVDRSLKAYVARLKRQKILEMRGRGGWDADLGELRGDANDS
jgi:Arc/MetJ family transcription regulator